MINFVKYILYFLVFSIIIILVGGVGIYLAQLSGSAVNTFLGLPVDSVWTTVVITLGVSFIALLLVPAILAISTKYKQPIVFISFKHVHEDKAIELEKRLQEAGLGTERLAFSPDYTHDEVVSQVIQKIRKADVVVTIPDAENASFVDSELLTATALKIPIVLIRYQEKQAQPGTLLLGYPVFDYQCVKSKNYDPLFRFLLFAARNKRDLGNQIKRILKQLFDPALLLTLALVIGIFLFIGLIIKLLRWFLLEVLDWSIGVLFSNNNTEMLHYLIIVLIVGFTVYAIGKAFYTLRVVRQVIVTGTNSYSIFEEEFSYLKKDNEMLACMQLNTLEAKGN